jgi:hypothetical protein
MNRENKGYRQTTFWKISKKEGVKREQGKGLKVRTKEEKGRNHGPFEEENPENVDATTV